MAENRCPMCGKPNPADREMCQFCEARLKPLIDSPAAEEDTSSLSPGSAPSPQDTGELERTLPAWLQDARGTPSQEEPFTESPEEGGDWLANLRDSSSSGDAVPSPGTEEDDQDWLQRIRALDSEEKAAEKPPFEEKEDVSEADLPDWLSALREEEPEAVPLATEEVLAGKSAFPFGEDALEGPFDKGGKPDWFEEESEKEAIEEDVSEADLPDWILEMRAEEPEAVPLATEEVLAREPASPFGEDAPEGPFDEDGKLDWFKEESEEEGVSETDLPDWLSEMEAEKLKAEPLGEEDVLARKPASPFGEDALEKPLDEGEALDWLEEESEEDVSEADVPDWLLAMDAAKLEEEPEAVPGAEEEVLIEKTVSSPFGEDVEDELFAGDGIPDWIEEGDEEEELEEERPDWLLEEEPSGEIELPFEETKSVFEKPFVGDEDGDGSSEDIFAGDLPLWLTDASDEELAEEGLSGEALEEITPGDLPGWVEAMRPVKTPSQEARELFDGEEEYVENAGPLAGMANILPTEAGIIKAQKAAKHSFKLMVTESQRGYISLLEDLIANEGKSEAIPTPSLISTQRVLRWIIALVLFLSVGMAFSYTGEAFSYPLHRGETRAVNESIQALSEASPVLVAFDYEPALSGEMNAIAAGVVDHLMLRGAYLTFVSTSPTGPVLVENFLSTTQADHNYVHSQQYVNLGYIPGGAAGLLSFVIAPQNIMPLAFDGADAWEMQPLQGIISISDFSLVLVITDDPDTARMWVEQVQSHLAGTPLVMAVSAQAEPLVRPYYEVTPQQVAGMVAGLPGGTSYEQLTGRGNLAQGYWNAFNIGIMATIAVLLISGIVNVIASQVNKNRSHNEEGA